MGFGQGQAQRILGARHLHRLPLGEPSGDRFPARLGLVEAPLDRCRNISGHLRPFNGGRIQVLFQVQGNFSGKGRRTRFATGADESQKDGK